MRQLRGRRVARMVPSRDESQRRHIPMAKTLLDWSAPVVRTVRFTADSIRAARDPDAATLGAPARRPTPTRIASVFAEEAGLTLGVKLMLRSKAGMSDLERISADTDRALTVLQARGCLDEPASYHPVPPPPTAFTLTPQRVFQIRCERLSFESGYQPVADLPGTDRHLALVPNRTAHAYVLENGGKPRPWVVLLHGYGMGHAADLLFWQAGDYHKLGCNVIAPVYPLHGLRRSRSPYLSLDWVANLHSLTQTVWDVRRCLAWIRQRGATGVAVHGISLGAYTAAMLAGLDPDLDCVVAGVPAATFDRLIVSASARSSRLHRRLTALDLIGDRLTAVNKLIRPTTFPPRIAPERCAIYAGLADRVAPPEESAMFWRHFGEPEVHWSPGSHVGTILTPAARRFAREAVAARLSL